MARTRQQQGDLAQIRSAVRRFLEGAFHDRELAEDVASETVLRLLQRRPRVRAPRNPIAYALRVGWHEALRRRRSRSRELDPQVASRSLGAPDPARLVELRDWLLEGLARLDPRDRALLHLRYEEELDLKSIARILRCPAGTVGWRLHGARMRLRSVLVRLGGERVELVVLALWPLFDEEVPGAGAGPPPADGATALAGSWAGGVVVPALLVVGLLAVTLLQPGFEAEAPEPGSVAGGRRAGTPAEQGTGGEPQEAVAVRPRQPPGRTGLSGEVVDARGAPVAGARVRCLALQGRGVPPAGGGAEAVTDEGGRFHLEAPTGSGPRDLLAEHPQYAPSLHRRVVPGGAGCRIVLEEGLELSGTVQDLQGRPIPQAALVYRTLLGRRPWSRRTSSGGDGRYRFTGIPAGGRRPDPASVEVRAPRYASRLVPTAMALPDEPLAPRQKTLDVHLALVASVAGRVTLRGAPVPVAEVALWSWHPAVLAGGRPGRAVEELPFGPRLLGRGSCDDAGRFEIRGLPVRIAGADASCPWFPGVPAPSLECPPLLVVTAPGLTPCAVPLECPREEAAVVRRNVALQEPARVKGRVVDAAGAPVKGVTVLAASPGEQALPGPRVLESMLAPSWWAQSTGDGSYLLPAVPADKGRVLVRVEGMPEASGVEVEPVAGETTVVPDLVLELPRPVHGIVTDVAGRPLPDALVGWSSGEPGRTGVPTDARGRFVLEPLPGLPAEKVVVTRPGRATRILAPGVEDGTAVCPLRVVLPPETTIRGRVVDAGGSPLVGVSVVPLEEAPPAGGTARQRLAVRPEHAWRGTVTDLQGRFELDGLPEGTHTLWAWSPCPLSSGLRALLAPGFLYDTWREGVASGSRGLVITLDAGAPGGHGALLVDVTGPGGAGPPLHDLHGSLLSDEGVLEGIAMCTGPGRLLFRRVAAGSHRLRVTAAEAAPFAREDVRINAGTTERLSVALAPPRTLSVVFSGVSPEAVGGELQVAVRPDAAPENPVVVMPESPEGCRVGGLGPEPYRVQARVITPAGAVRAASAIRVIQSGDQEETQTCRLRLVETGTLVLRLRGVLEHRAQDARTLAETLQELRGHRLVLADPPGRTWLDCRLHELRRRAQGEDLLLEVRVPPGTYTLTCSSPAGPTERLAVSVPGAAALTLP